MAPNMPDRYQRASDLLEDLLAARKRGTGGRSSGTEKAGPPGPENGDALSDLQSRLKARQTPQPRFCWHCRKPLHARSDRCPFCGEAQ
jgi:hypothetical protein